ncbi:MAG: hypothetical protein SGPRY_006675, partial [Prymnesium sp.]
KVLHEMELLEMEDVLLEEQQPMQNHHLREDDPAQWKEIMDANLSSDEGEERDDGGDDLHSLCMGCDATSGSSGELSLMCSSGSGSGTHAIQYRGLPWIDVHKTFFLPEARPLGLEVSFRHWMRQLPMALKKVQGDFYPTWAEKGFTLKLVRSAKHSLISLSARTARG